MLYYIIPIILSFILGLFNLNKYEKYKPLIFNIIVLYSVFIFCFGYMTGSDWKEYELMYDTINLDNLFDVKKEWFFYVFMAFFKLIGIDFFPFLILTKIIVFLIYLFYIKKWTNLPYVPFAIFLSYNVLFLFIDNPLRFLIATGIVLFSFEYLFSRRFLPFLLIIIISSLFHVSALIMIPIYFLSKYEFNKTLLIIIYIFSAIFLKPEFFFNYIQSYIPSLQIMMGSYYDKILISEYQTFAVGKIVFFIFFCLILACKQLIINYSLNGKYIYNLSLLSLLIAIIVSAIPTFFRLAIFISLFVVISLSIIIFNKRNVIINTFIICYFLFSVVTTTLSSYVYTPYSNYLFLVQKDLPYSYRVNYNKEKYFERYNKYP